MSEPTTFADRIEMPLPGLLHWTLQDDRINFRADAYGLATPDGVVLIDPLPLSESALSESLDAVAAICLTEGQHQRSAWRYRKRFGAPVHAPEGAHALDESPDHFDTSHEPEYMALRQAAGLIDVTPLFKYEVHGPGAARHEPAREKPRGAAPAPGRPRTGRRRRHPRQL